MLNWLTASWAQRSLDIIEKSNKFSWFAWKKLIVCSFRKMHFDLCETTSDTRNNGAINVFWFCMHSTIKTCCVPFVCCNSKRYPRHHSTADYNWLDHRLHWYCVQVFPAHSRDPWWWHVLHLGWQARNHQRVRIQRNNTDLHCDTWLDGMSACFALENQITVHLMNASFVGHIPAFYVYRSSLAWGYWCA